MKMENPQLKKPLNSYIKYTGIAFQMAATIAIFTLIGYWIDAHYEHDKPIVTLILMLIGTGISIFTLIKQLGSEK